MGARLDLRSGGEEPEAPSISVALLLRLERKDALGFGIEGAMVGRDASHISFGLSP